MDESGTIKKILEGKKESFKKLSDKYAQRIFAYLYRFLGNDKEQAEDLTQEVFLKAYEKIATFDINKKFSPWIYRIAHNEAVNFIKKNSRNMETSLTPEHWENIKTTESSAADKIDKLNEIKLTRKALHKIKPKFKEVLVLHYFEEKSYEEIAKIINKPRNTVGILIMRGKKHLKKMIESMK